MSGDVFDEIGIKSSVKWTKKEKCSLKVMTQLKNYLKNVKRKKMQNKNFTI